MPRSRSDGGTMAVDERRRHEMYLAFEELVGGEVATTMMEHLPPVGWADVATKHDVEHEIAILRAEMQQGSRSCGPRSRRSSQRVLMWTVGPDGSRASWRSSPRSSPAADGLTLVDGSAGQVRARRSYCSGARRRSRARRGGAPRRRTLRRFPRGCGPRSDPRRDRRAGGPGPAHLRPRTGAGRRPRTVDGSPARRCPA